MIFFNTQKITSDEKRIIISDNCEFFLGHIIGAIDELGLEGDEVILPLDDLLAEIKRERKGIGVKDLDDAKRYNFVGEVSVEKSGDFTLPVSIKKIKDNFTAIKLMNSIQRFNTKQQKKIRS